MERGTSGKFTEELSKWKNWLTPNFNMTSSLEFSWVPYVISTILSILSYIKYKLRTFETLKIWNINLIAILLKESSVTFLKNLISLKYKSPYIKISSKCIKNLNLQPEPIKLLEEKIGSTLHDIGLDIPFFFLIYHFKKSHQKRKQSKQKWTNMTAPN